MPASRSKATSLNDFGEVKHVVHVLHGSPLVLLAGQSNAFLTTNQTLALPTQLFHRLTH
jgi:hypothetical protein